MDRPTVAYTRTADELDLPPGHSLVAAIRDDSQGGRLSEALEFIHRGEANTLFAPYFGDLATSFKSLVALLEWLEEAGASLVAADVQLDTASSAGRKATALLREIDRLEQRQRPRGRPGLGAVSPKLAERITAMRQAGDSLHAIAYALNRDGVPTPRGGAAWRASSVQSVLGYRRPRPPAPGLAPPKPPKPPKPPHKKAP